MARNGPSVTMAFEALAQISTMYVYKMASSNATFTANLIDYLRGRFNQIAKCFVVINRNVLHTARNILQLVETQLNKYEFQSFFIGRTVSRKLSF